ncbi:MAG: DNA polymerase III subunit alpha, partial [Alphaproteobacteria bacterium]|nr:DNA polymerase III subunit alpha [Alphaproteobacteria bacterium]
ELERLRIEVLPPDVNRSRATFSIEIGADGICRVRYALAALKNVGANAMDALVDERKRGGPFIDIYDFARRLDTKTINRRQVENLVKAGAMDCLEKNRCRVFGALDMLFRISQQAAEERQSNQVNLFGNTAEPSRDMPETVDWVDGEKRQYEYEAIGLHLRDPLQLYARTLSRLNVLRSDEVGRHLKMGGGGRVKMAGKLDKVEDRKSARGNRFAILHLTAASGGYTVFAFAEVLAASRALLEPGAALLLTIDARLEDDQLRLTCQQIENLDAAAARTAGGLRVVIDSEAAIPPLRDLLGREAKGRGRIVVVPRWPGREVEIALKGAYALSPATIGALRTVPGVVEVAEV